MLRRASALSLFILLLVLVASCAPAAGGTAHEPNQTVGRSPFKRLVAAIQSDPTTLTNTLVISSGQPGVAEVEEMVWAGLTDADPQGVRQPFLAEAAPSLENGLWKLAPDSMETTWTIRADAVWYDGEPVTTDDLVFTLEFVRDPQIIEFNNSSFRLISGVEPTDARTLTVRWSGPLNNADALFSRGFANPLPKHLVESLYQDDKPRLPRLALLDVAVRRDGRIRGEGLHPERPHDPPGERPVCPRPPEDR